MDSGSRAIIAGLLQEMEDMHCTYKEDVGRWEQECAALQDTVQVRLSCLRLLRRCCAVDRWMGPDPDPAGALCPLSRVVGPALVRLRPAAQPLY